MPGTIKLQNIFCGVEGELCVNVAKNGDDKHLFFGTCTLHTNLG